MPISQAGRSKEMRMKIYQDIFSKMEKGFEDLLLPEYAEIKNAILNLMDKDPDKLRKVMYTISNMTIEDMYEYIIRLETTRKQGYKANNMTKCLEKIKARREEINKNNEKDEETREEQPISAKETKENHKKSKQLYEAQKALKREVDRIKSEFSKQYGISTYCKYFEHEIHGLISSTTNLTIEDVTLYTENIKNKTLLDIYKEKLAEIEGQIESANGEKKEKLEKYRINTEKNIQRMEKAVNQHSQEEHSNEQSQPTSNAKDEKNEQEQETSNNEEKRKLEKELKSMFRHKEERFEDILIYSYEYEYFKKDIFKLLDKDLDGVKSIMNEMRNMTLLDIYSKMLEAAQKSGQERKEKYISKTLRKIKQRDIEIKKEAEEEAKKEEELKNYKSKDDKRSKNNKDKKTGQDKKGGKDSKNREGKKPYEKTTIEVDTQHNKIVICAKGQTRSYKVDDIEGMKLFIKNGKEYKNMKETIKNGEKEKKVRVFDKKAVKKADPLILGILIDAGDMDAAKEYVRAFKDENDTSIDLKYTFGEHYSPITPNKVIKNYETAAKRAEKSADATVEGLKKGPVGRFMDWRNARKTKKLEAAKDDKSNGTETTVKEQESEAKNNFKDEMSKGAPSAEKQAEKAKEFGEKAQKRERKYRKTAEKVK